MKIKKNRKQLQAAVANLAHGAAGFEKQVQDFIIAASNEIHRIHNTLRLISISQEALITHLENKGLVNTEEIQAISKAIMEKQIKDAEAQQKAREEATAKEAVTTEEIKESIANGLATAAEATKTEQPIVPEEQK